MANRTKLTSEKETQFLHVLSETANVTRAAESIGMARGYMYELRDEDPEFKAQWNAAVEIGTDALEDEATRRATEGWDEPVFYQGAQCGLVRKFSDTLLIVQLKARRPARYRDNVTTQTQQLDKDGNPITPGPTYIIAREEAKEIGQELDQKV
jgi:hypothetical protein